MITTHEVEVDEDGMEKSSTETELGTLITGKSVESEDEADAACSLHSSEQNGIELVKVEGSVEEKETCANGETMQCPEDVLKLRQMFVWLYFNSIKEETKQDPDSKQFEHFCQRCKQRTIYCWQPDKDYLGMLCLSTPCLQRELEAVRKEDKDEDV